MKSHGKTTDGLDLAIPWKKSPGNNTQLKANGAQTVMYEPPTERVLDAFQLKRAAEDLHQDPSGQHYNTSPSLES